MSDDIVTRLRNDECYGTHCEPDDSLGCTPCEAADEIERLQTEVEILKKALYLSCKNLAGEMWGNSSGKTYDEYVRTSVDYWIETAQEDNSGEDRS